VEINAQASMNFNPPSKATRHVDYISPHGIAFFVALTSPQPASFGGGTSFSYPPRLLESRRDAAVPKNSTLEEFRAVFSHVLSSK